MEMAKSKIYKHHVCLEVVLGTTYIYLKNYIDFSYKLLEKNMRPYLSSPLYNSRLRKEQLQ